MREKSGEFKGAQGVRLFYKAWLPDETPKAVLSIVHGVGEHICRYMNLVNGLVPAGYALIGYDQRGHGRSEGQRGHINSWQEYRNDLGIFLNMARELMAGLPMFLYGHSMGSLVVLDYLIHDSAGLNGAIISGIALEPTGAAPPVLVLAAKILSAIAPTCSLKTKLEGSSLSRYPEVAQAYMEDPLVHWQRSARWGTESLRVIASIKTHARQIALPVLFLHGERDPLVTVQGARHFVDQISSQDKTLIIYPDGLHEPHNDLCAPQVIEDIRNWMEAHLGSSGQKD